jgi:hypothetical protein
VKKRRQLPPIDGVPGDHSSPRAAPTPPRLSTGPDAALHCTVRKGKCPKLVAWEVAPWKKKWMWIMPENGATSPSHLRRGAPSRYLAPVVRPKGGGARAEGAIFELDLT